MTRALWIWAMIAMLVLSSHAGKAIAEQNSPHDIKFNLRSIRTLPKQDQERILMILRSTKLISPGEDLSILDGIHTTDIFNDLGRALCRASCESSRGSAQGACSAIPNGAASAACHVAAGAAQTVCKDRCLQIPLGVAP
jgi:hypothetical protein